ncbi:NfeD family protein [Terribacillus halophilus]|jgi:membrane-bound ClpP family serine protease|uniref:NfeD family protein n=1 Tax=Terribacillus halophilus TaxID=361279 RepID=UPI000984B9E8|nr:NfeD family protein [Terribacillus halophilus]
MLDYNWVSIFMTGLGTMFLIGEILVKARGILFLLGAGFIGTFFISYLDPSAIWYMLPLYFVGMLLIIIDGKLLNDGTLSVIGLLTMLLTVGFTAPNWTAGIYAIIGVIVGAFASFLFLKAFPKRDMWGKITLLDSLSSDKGYNSVNETYAALLEQEGETITDMRPSGTIRVGGRELSAITDGKWLDSGTRIKVKHVSGARILVEKIES